MGSGINIDTYNGSKAVSSIASSSGNPDVVAFGGSDKALRVWDSRSRKGEGLAVQVGPKTMFTYLFVSSVSQCLFETLVPPLSRHAPLMEDG